MRPIYVKILPSFGTNNIAEYGLVVGYVWAGKIAMAVIVQGEYITQHPIERLRIIDSQEFIKQTEGV